MKSLNENHKAILLQFRQACSATVRLAKSGDLEAAAQSFEAAGNCLEFLRYHESLMEAYRNAMNAASAGILQEA